MIQHKQIKLNFKDKHNEAGMVEIRMYLFKLTYAKYSMNYMNFLNIQIRTIKWNFYSIYIISDYNQFLIRYSMEQFNINENQQYQTTQRRVIQTQKPFGNYQQLYQNYKFDQLTPLKIYAYGVGHFLNDLTAAYWFNFSLYFLVTIAQTKAAAFTFLIGQVVDSITTPLVGYYSDKINSKYGQRMPWYCVGLFIIIFTFPWIFHPVHDLDLAWQMAYYGVFAGLFNVGWAFCQISHMSLVPSLSCSKKRRQKLNNIRNTFTFIANFILLGLVSLFLSLKGNHKEYFFYIALIVLTIGIIPSLFFIINIRQTKLVKKCEQYRIKLQQITNNQKSSPLITFESSQPFKWYFWLKKSAFYFYGFAYVTARLSVNVMITILPFYVKKLSHSNDEKDITIALLLLYLSSIFTSAYTKKILQIVGAKWILALGFLLSILASVILCQAYNSIFEIQFIYLATFIIGIAQAIILNSVLNFICQIIGSNGLKGGFVFGSYSFMDKISTGVVVYLISNGPNLNNSDFIKYLILLLPPVLSLMSCLMVCVAIPSNAKKQKQSEKFVKKSLLEEQLV